MQSKLRLKSQDALYDKRLSLFCLYDPVSELLFARNEIEVRNIRLLAVKYVVYLGIEELRVDCVYGFEILQTVRSGRDLVALFIVIVYAYVDRLKTFRHKLYAELFGAGGLSGGAWTGKQHQSSAAAFYPVGDLDHALVVHGFADLDYLFYVSFFVLILKISERRKTEVFAPLSFRFQTAFVNDVVHRDHPLC